MHEIPLDYELFKLIQSTYKTENLKSSENKSSKYIKLINSSSKTDLHSELVKKTLFNANNKNTLSAKALICTKKINYKNPHEIMLRQELNDFRHEIEKKFRNSDCNRVYVFPRKDHLVDPSNITMAVNCMFYILI